MRHSFVALVGTVLVGIVACGDGDPVGWSASGGAGGSGTGGSSGSGGVAGRETGSSGKGTAGSSGTNAESGGSGGSSTGGKGNAGAGAGTGGKGSAGAGGKGSAGAGGRADGGETTHAGEGGMDASGGTGNAGSGGTVNAGAGGTDDAGAGGSDDTGVGGEGGASDSPCAKGEAFCSNVCIDPQDRTLDQMMLESSGYISINASQTPGQSFTVGASGRLVGIEVPVGPCGDAPTTGRVQLSLFDANDVNLGAVTISQTDLPNACGTQGIAQDTIGTSYFDLTPLCVTAAAGDVLAFTLSLVGMPAQTCDLDAYRCTNIDRSCFEDRDCQARYGAGVTNCGGTGCLGAPSDYTGGSVVMRNLSNGDTSPMTGFDIPFKTFVQ